MTIEKSGKICLPLFFVVSLLYKNKQAFRPFANNNDYKQTT